METRVSLSSTQAKHFAAILTALRKNVAAQDDTRPVLQAISFAADNGKLTMTAADGFVLATVTAPWACEAVNAGAYERQGFGIFGTARDSLLYPGDLDGLVAMLKVKAKEHGYLDLTFKSLGSAGITIELQGQRVAQLKNDGTFPDVRNLYDGAEERIGKFECTAFAPQLLERAMRLFKTVDTSAVRFRTTGTSQPAWLEDNSESKDEDVRWRAKCLAMPMFVQWPDTDKAKVQDETREAVAA